MREFCDRYAEADIGFVDAAVMAIVERLGETKLATLTIATSDCSALATWMPSGSCRNSLHTRTSRQPEYHLRLR